MAKEWIYGFHAITAAIEAGQVLQVIADSGRQDKRMQQLLMEVKNSGVVVSFSNQKVIEEMIGEGHRHQGVIAQVKVRAAQEEADLYQLIEELQHPPFLLILDEVQDPHNVGACLRSAEAFGVDAVIIPKDNSCGLTPVVRKVSSGSSERVPFIEVTNLVRTLTELKERGIWLTGLAGSGEQTLFQSDFRGAVAIIMGSEGRGLRRLTEKACDFLVKIPMEGEVESLNVSVATGVALAEAYRQRQHG